MRGGKIKKEEPKNLRDVRENVLNQKREIVLKSVFQKELKEEDKIWENWYLLLSFVYNSL